MRFLADEGVDSQIVERRRTRRHHIPARQVPVIIRSEKRVYVEPKLQGRAEVEISRLNKRILGQRRKSGTE